MLFDDGKCQIEGEGSIRGAEPPEPVMGDMAGVSVYREDTDGIRLCDRQRQRLTAWQQMEPPPSLQEQLTVGLSLHDVTKMMTHFKSGPGLRSE